MSLTSANGQWVKMQRHTQWWDRDRAKKMCGKAFPCQLSRNYPLKLHDERLFATNWTQHTIAAKCVLLSIFNYNCYNSITNYRFLASLFCNANRVLVLVSTSHTKCIYIFINGIAKWMKTQFARDSLFFFLCLKQNMLMNVDGEKLLSHRNAKCTVNWTHFEWALIEFANKESVLIFNALSILDSFLHGRIMIHFHFFLCWQKSGHKNENFPSFRGVERNNVKIDVKDMKMFLFRFGIIWILQCESVTEGNFELDKITNSDVVLWNCISN